MHKLSALVLLLAATARAHVISMSSSELKVQNRTATFELRMPVYEIQHVAQPETSLLDHVRFAEARRTSGACHAEEDTYICRATFEFPRPVPDKLDVECTLFQVTVPNHVHLLQATQGANSDQAVFDRRFTKFEVRFRPPSPAQMFARDAAAGIARLVASFPAMLFLAALALAARSWREAALFLAVFLAGEWMAVPIAPRIPIPLSPGFLEAAMALTSAYLAVDVLLLPQSRSRWAAIPVLGLVHGFYLASFPSAYLAGASVIQITAACILAVATLRLPQRFRTAMTAIALAAALGWFIRLLVV